MENGPGLSFEGLFPVKTGGTIPFQGAVKNDCGEKNFRNIRAEFGQSRIRSVEAANGPGGCLKG